ncbi:MAG: glycosyltransferase [Moraxellaceae bacterium]|nr:glycosyltransferase [Moraxellaceae bacterium]
MARPPGASMRFIFLCKRYYTNKDLLDDRFGRLYHLPVELARRGHAVEVLALDYRHVRGETRRLEGVDFTALPAAPLVLPLLPLRLLARLRRAPCDVVVASGDSHIGYLGLLGARVLKARFAFDIYDYYPAFPGNRLPGMKSMFAAAAASAELLLCASPPLMERLQPLNARRLLVENGVDRQLFRALPGTSKARQCSGEGPVIGYFGSISASRGPLLVEACRRLRGKWPGLRLLMAGVAQDVSLDEAWIDYRGALPQQELPALIAACDVLAVPYASTPFNDMSGACKLAEYLACERPIVATRIAGHETVLGSGAQGLCGQDPDDMARAIERQMQDPEILPFPAHLDWRAIAAQMERALARSGAGETA